mmetsp:Transcript_447/g.981  ORF Transcript_447/g.981 Transcript_447/m.981 type:complete len:344 (+) Transcript_447:84-1115(+)|eukprot:CAMPEP_0172614002 /NCGR_PEP_ID=MMETSP1068-20121228/49124_1 /TAXON_ID=35684 /ORGANISM="Pseudopedinella elastica, Strain CCMP716" /LENGTH=343 /DNA_ID=CAMNT_0013418655 /DNA_START=74 /DNA_END=1105 /DNA_ORIENTATION=-
MATGAERYAVGGGGNDDDVKKTEAQKDEEAKARTEKMRIAVGCLVSYFVFGWIAYCAVFENWTFTNATYFLMVTLTTVGYGDIYPSTQASRLFTMFFVLFGISIVAVALVEVANYFIEKREALVKKTQADVIKKASAEGTQPGEGDAKDAKETPYAKFKSFLAAHPIVDVVLNLSLYSLIAGGIFVGIEGWNLVDSIYFTIITGTTVGYGDISPQTPVGRWFAVFFLPFAVIFVSTQLSSLANILLGKNEDGKLKALLGVDLSLEALLNMDTDGDGEITEFEFIKFMMVTAGMADEETLDSLHKRFEEMDADGSGALTREDIELILEEKKKAEAAAEAEEDGE